MGGAVIEPKELKNGVNAWVDRAYVYENVPAEMVGATLYSSLCKSISGGYFTVEAAAGAIVYIFCEAEHLHRNGGFPSLGWKQIDAGCFQWEDDKGKKSWGMSVWKQVHSGGLLKIPTTDCLVGGLAIQMSSSPAPTKEKMEAEKVIETLRAMTFGMDIRKVLPKLAELMLGIIDDTQIPELFELLDPLLLLVEGSLDLDDLRTHIARGIEVVKALPKCTQQELGARMLSAVMASVAQVCTQPSTVEAHMNVVCDGCEQSPITGPRYKCNIRPDFDLCGRCHARRHEINATTCQDEWTQVKTNTHADVVGFTFNQCGPCITCDGCNKSALAPNDRHKCAICPDYDLCSTCFSNRGAIHHHDSWLELDAPAPQSDPIFCVPAAVVPVGVPPPEETNPAPETTQTDGAHFYIGDELQPSLTSAAIALLLEHPDEAVRAATQQALSEAASAQHVPETDTEEETAQPSEEDWEKASAETIPEPKVPEAQEEDKAEIGPEKSAKVLQAVMTFGNTEQGVFDLAEARGDVTQEFAGLLSQYPQVNQAFRLGRLAIFHGEPDASSMVKVIITNNGTLSWPEVSALRAVSGPAYGFPELALGAVPPGETVELVMDLAFGLWQAGAAECSGWAMIDEHGQPYGPLLLLEVTRV